MTKRSPTSRAKKTTAAPRAKAAPSNLFEAKAGAKIGLYVDCPGPAANLHPIFTKPEWRMVRANANAAAAPDLVAPLTDLSAIPNASCDGIWSAHTLQRLLPHEIPAALDGCYRILKEGGFMLIATPDTQAIAKPAFDGRLEEPLYNSTSGPITPLDLLYGVKADLARGELYKLHRTGFMAVTLGQKLRAAGFFNVEVRRDGYHLIGVGYRLEATDKPKRDQVLVVDKNAPSSAKARPGAQADELDAPPQIWKPLGLKK